MEDFIRIEENDYIFYINRTNIAGVSICKTYPHQLSILMVGDTMPTDFTFSDVEKRNEKLTEILREAPDRITNCPQEVSAE